MVEQFSPTPPAGYTYRGDLFEDLRQRFERARWRLWLRANFKALIPLGICVVMLWIPYKFYMLLGTPLALFAEQAWPSSILIIVGLVGIIGSVALHELLHAAVLKLTGHKPCIIIRTGVPHTGLEKGDFLPRNHFLLMALAPLVIMTLGGGIGLFFLPPSLGEIAMIVLLLNCAASIADLMVFSRVRRWPAEALFADELGIRVYTPHTKSN